MDASVLGILIGALGGAVIGVERERSGHASGLQEHFAGVRTLTLIGGLAAMAGALWTGGFHPIAVTILAGSVGVIVAAYAAISRRDIDATTEVAALIVVTAGVFAGIGFWRLASGIVVVTAILLVEKSRLHALVARIPDASLLAGFRFALMAVVILPLLPQGPYGPLGGFRPREVWMLVLLFSGISFLAYIVRSLRGPGQGYVWAGALGGLISSTNVTLSFSRLSRVEKDSTTPLALGVIAACTMLYFRVLAATSLLNPGLAWGLLPYLVAPALVGAAFIWYGFHTVTSTDTPPMETSPLQFRSAVQMAVLFQIVLFVLTAVQGRWGSTGLLVSGAILGLTDVDALVLSMSRTTASLGVQQAAAATVIGILANTFLKTLLAAGIGQRGYRKVAVIGLLALFTATALPLIATRAGRMPWQP